MKKTMNNKGYMLIEIVLAAALAFGIATIIIGLVIKLKNRNDDELVDTLTSTDTIIITNKLMEYAIAEKENFNCDNLILENGTLKYQEEGQEEPTVIDIFNEYVNFDGESNNIQCSNEYGQINIFIPIDINQMPGKDYDIDINYKYIIGDLTYPYIRVEVKEPTIYTQSKKANIVIGNSNGLLGGTYRIKYAWSNTKIPCSKISDDNYVDIYVTDKQKEASLSEDKYIEVNGGSGKGKIYVCNLTPISDYNKINILPETIADGIAYLDNTPPTCALTNGSGKVYFSSLVDKDSGVLDYGINKKANTPTYDKATHDVTSKRLGFSYDVTYYGYVRDNAGNVGNCSKRWESPPPSGSGGCCGSMGYCDCGCDPSNSRCG